MADVQLRSVAKRYGEVRAVESVNLDIAHNEFLVLVGPSGCGKSTILRMIAGLEEISDGEISIGGRVVNELAPKDRDIAMVFQDYALYPHLTVYQNMSFGLEMQRRPAEEIRRRVEEAARILSLEALLQRKPKQLSGGQRQRVAMGRAIVRHPKVFLFDEPLSNLDAKLRVQMRTEIKKLHRQVATTVIYVTHDQVEAMTLADRIVVLRDGLVEQIGTPDEIYNAPATTFVAGFIGAPTMNLLPAQLVGTGNGIALQLADDVAIALPAENAERYRQYLGVPVTFGIRPEHFGAIDERPAAPGFARLTGRVDLVEPLGSDTLVYLQVGAHDLVARLPPKIPAVVGDPITLGIDMAQMRLFDATTGRDIT